MGLEEMSVIILTNGMLYMEPVYEKLLQLQG